MTQPHPHKDILIAIANGVPLDEVELRHSKWPKDVWIKIENYQFPFTWIYDDLETGWEVRIKPKTVMFNGVELPEPVTETPNDEQAVYIPRPDRPDNYEELHWINSKYDRAVLAKGLVHKAKEDAIAWAIAMTPVKN